MVNFFAFVQSCTSDTSLVSNSQAIVDILEISKQVGAKIYPFLAGAGFVIGFSKVI